MFSAIGLQGAQLFGERCLKILKDEGFENIKENIWQWDTDFYQHYNMLHSLYQNREKKVTHLKLWFSSCQHISN